MINQNVQIMIFHMIYNIIKCMQQTWPNIDVNIIYP
jgi:hypothetical protein